jgi:hypothetical protein
MAGLPVSIDVLDQTFGRAVVTLAQALDTATAVNAMILDANRFNGATGLVANQGYTTTAANLIVASFADLTNLANVARGVTGYQVQIGGGTLGPSNFFFNAQKLMGPVPL